MFKNTFQSGLLSIFYSCGSGPLSIWDTEVKNGHIKRIIDKDVNSIVLEIASTNVATTYITCPRGNQYLGIRLPFLIMIVKNLKKYFSFEITIRDDRNMKRRFRISNFQSTTKIKPFCTTMPIGLSDGWNQIQFNLADFTRRAYGSEFIETVRVQIHANVRLRRIYFSDKLYTEEELPQEYKLYLPLERSVKKGKQNILAKKEESLKKAQRSDKNLVSPSPKDTEPIPKSAAPIEEPPLEDIMVERKRADSPTLSTEGRETIVTDLPESDVKDITPEAENEPPIEASDKVVNEIPGEENELQEGEPVSEKHSAEVDALAEVETPGEAETPAEAPAEGEFEASADVEILSEEPHEQ